MKKFGFVFFVCFVCFAGVLFGQDWNNPAASGGGGESEEGGGFPVAIITWYEADFSAAAGNSPAYIVIDDGIGGFLYGRMLEHTSNSKMAWVDSYVSTGGVMVIRTPLAWETGTNNVAWDAVLGICYGNSLTPFVYVTNTTASFSHTNTEAYAVGNDIEWCRWTNTTGSGFFRFVLDKSDTPATNDSLILFGNPSISVE